MDIEKAKRAKELFDQLEECKKVLEDIKEALTCEKLGEFSVYITEHPFLCSADDMKTGQWRVSWHFGASG